MRHCQLAPCYTWNIDNECMCYAFSIYHLRTCLERLMPWLHKKHSQREWGRGSRVCARARAFVCACVRVCVDHIIRKWKVFNTKKTPMGSLNEYEMIFMTQKHCPIFQGNIHLLSWFNQSYYISFFFLFLHAFHVVTWPRYLIFFFFLRRYTYNFFDKLDIYLYKIR